MESRFLLNLVYTSGCVCKWLMQVHTVLKPPSPNEAHCPLLAGADYFILSQGDILCLGVLL